MFLGSKFSKCKILSPTQQSKSLNQVAIRRLISKISRDSKTKCTEQDARFLPTSLPITKCKLLIGEFLALQYMLYIKWKPIKRTTLCTFQKSKKIKILKQNFYNKKISGAKKFLASSIPKKKSVLGALSTASWPNSTRLMPAANSTTFYRCYSRIVAIRRTISRNWKMFRLS
jgi:hypothetical protein